LFEMGGSIHGVFFPVIMDLEKPIVAISSKFGRNNL